MRDFSTTMPKKSGKMHVGDVLELIHDKHNRYDRRVVTVRWEGRMIGYLSRKENTTESQMLGRGMSLHGCISSLNQSSNPWERIAELRTFVTETPSVLAC